LKEHRENRNKIDPPKFSEAVELFERELEHDTTIKPQSKQYRLWCLGKLQKTWPELWGLRSTRSHPKPVRSQQRKPAASVFLENLSFLFGGEVASGWASLR